VRPLLKKRVADRSVPLVQGDRFAGAFATLLGVFLCALTPAPPAHSQGLTRGQIAIDHVRRTGADLGLVASDLTDVVITDVATTRRTGVSHIYLRQRLNSIEVANANLAVHLDRNDEVKRLVGKFARHLVQNRNATTPTLTPRQAILRAAEHLGVGPQPAGSTLEQLEASTGAERKARFRALDVSLDEITVKLAYFVVRDPADPGNGPSAVRLAWELVIRPPGQRHWWHAWIDATTGALLDRVDWVANDSYRVLAAPIESPNHGSRTLEVDPADLTASPYGWHDTNGSAGAEYTITRGNNVHAQEDQNGNNGSGSSPNGGGSLVFDYSIDFADEPSLYEDATITNLFYWNNILHDVLYQYGFDEASGNFQSNNYGNGGSANDYVLADAQDGSDINNADFATPPDGFNPRMQMFLFSPAPTELLTLSSPVEAAGGYVATEAVFGGAVPIAPAEVAGSIIIASDGTGSPTLACSALTNGGAVAGNIALIDRGSCNFTVKVKNAQNAGAVAVVMVNNVAGDPITMGGTDPSVTIPSVMVSMSDGDIIRNALSPVGALSNPGVGPAIAGDLDNGIIAHEYCHGLSNRLTGGRTNVSCLGNDEQAGEGWSDFCSLFMTAESGDLGADARPVGTFVSGQATSGSGIRVYPYSTDFGINPHTYDDIKTATIPHGVGEVFATALWDMYWNLVDVHGFDADLYNGGGGSNLAIQLVVDGLKLQPCSPSFLDSRDAILQADALANASANECSIWRAFAGRGMGASAIDGSSASVIDGSESFDVPLQCVVCSDGLTEGSEECDDGNLNDNDDCTNACTDAICGDASLWDQGLGSEQCDDGGTTPGDGCSATCQIEPDFSLGLSAASLDICQPNSGNVTVNIGSIGGFAAAVTLSTAGAPAGLTVGFSPNPVDPAPGATTLTFSNTALALAGSYLVAVQGTGSPGIESEDLDLEILPLPPGVTLSVPSDTAVEVVTEPTYMWSSEPLATGYAIEIATDPGFTAIVDSASIATNQHPGVELSPGTMHYWRVRAENGCGSSANSATSSFTTVIVAMCGNGDLEGDEECDDGNTLPNDGCSESCEIEFIEVPAFPNAGAPWIVVLLLVASGMLLLRGRVR
jgi:cysteine-rich repeat protein